MNNDTARQQEAPWGQDVPAVPEARSELEALLLEAVGPQEKASARSVGRPATLSTLHLGLAVLWYVLSGWKSQRGVWRLICTRRLGPFAPVRVSDQAVYNRLHGAGEALLQAVFVRVSHWLRAWMTPYQDRRIAPFAHEVYALDESVLDAVARRLRPLREVAAGDRGLLAGRLSALFDVRRQLWVRLEVLAEAGANCKVHARAMLEGLPTGSLLLFDLGYYGFEWFDELTQQGIWWISRLRARGSYRLQHVLVELEGYRESLVQLGAYGSDQAASTVRLVEFTYRGTWYCYVTNVRDPRLLSGRQIAQLYARRWDIEMAFRALKDYLGLRVLWSATWEGIKLQVWACAILAQCVHGLQVRLAAEASVEVFEVSFELLLEQASQRVGEGKVLPLSDWLTVLQEQGRQIALIRPCSRITIAVPAIPWTCFAWPPADLVYERTPRYAHKPAGNRDRQPPSAGVT